MHKALKHKHGVSTTEFLICGPIVICLIMTIYDLNKRLEERQTTTILARNAAYLGAMQDSSHADLRRLLVRDLTFMKPIVDQNELRQYTATPSHANNKGLHVDVRSRHLHDANQPELSERLAHATEVNTVSKDGSASTYNNFAAGIGAITANGAPVLSRLTALASEVAIVVDDQIRIAGVEAHASGEHNAIQRALSMLEAMVQTHQVGTRVELLPRRFAHGSYARVGSAYHSNDYTTSTLPGMGLGYLSRRQWGGSDNFGDNKPTLHQRCFTRLALNNACGDASTLQEASTNLNPRIQEISHRIKRYGELAQALERSRQEALEQGNHQLAEIYQRQIMKLASRIEQESSAMVSSTGNQDTSRHFLSKIRTIATAKFAASIIMTIIGNPQKAFEAPAQVAIDTMSDQLTKSLSEVVTNKISGQLSFYQEHAQSKLQDVASNAFKDLRQLQSEIPATSFKGKLGGS